MKLLFLVFLYTSSIAQTTDDYIIENFHALSRSKGLINRLSVNKLTIEQQKISKKILLDTSLYKNYDCIGIEYLIPFFQFIDLDGDKDLDIVFEGKECEGFESETTIIYIKKNGKYIKNLEKNGNIVIFTKPYTLTVYQHPCCSMVENTFISYSINKDTIIEKSNVILFNSYIVVSSSKDYENMMPTKLKYEKTIELKKETPIYYVPKDSLENPTFIKNNNIGFTANTINTKSYAHYLDAKGQQWAYCLMNRNDYISNNKNLKYPIVCWVKITKL